MYHTVASPFFATILPANFYCLQKSHFIYICCRLFILSVLYLLRAKCTCVKALAVKKLCTPYKANSKNEPYFSSLKYKAYLQNPIFNIYPNYSLTLISMKL